jgi:hypothetical protein
MKFELALYFLMDKGDKNFLNECICLKTMHIN